MNLRQYVVQLKSTISFASHRPTLNENKSGTDRKSKRTVPFESCHASRLAKNSVPFFYSCHLSVPFLEKESCIASPGSEVCRIHGYPCILHTWVSRNL